MRRLPTLQSRIATAGPKGKERSVQGNGCGPTTAFDSLTEKDQLRIDREKGAGEEHWRDNCDNGCGGDLKGETLIHQRQEEELCPFEFFHSMISTAGIQLGGERATWKIKQR